MPANAAGKWAGDDAALAGMDLATGVINQLEIVALPEALLRGDQPFDINNAFRPKAAKSAAAA